jgi:Asp-tRNA(Asn)/Glu-tRNA(Gln) amidotransferase C subunit
MTRQTLEHLAHDLAAEIALPAEEWDAIVTQAAAMLGWIKMLDELPLENVEPASVAGIDPAGEGKP